MSQTYTLCEVKQNNGCNGEPVWIVIKGVVYDVTKFLKEHPGGSNALMEYAGKDATKAFNQVGHSTDAIRDMKLYKIGVIANECLTHLKSHPETDVITSQPTKKTECSNAASAELVKQCCGMPTNKTFKILSCC